MRIAIFILMSLLLAAAAAAGILLMLDPNVFRGQIESGASAAFGRPFHIDGEIGLERSLRPQIILREISIDNPDWAAGAHLARADHVAVRVALLPLLRGKLQVMDVTFTDTEINIEHGPGGANNYSFGDRGDGDTVWWLPSINHMLIRNAVLNYRATGQERHFEISTAQLWNTPGEPERLAVEGLAHDIQFALAFKAEPDAALSGPGNPWSINLEMQGGGLAAKIEGRMPRAFAWQQFDGRIAIRGEQTDKLALPGDMDLPLTGPFEISAAMQTADSAITLSGLKGRINGFLDRHDIQFTGGELTVNRSALLKLDLQGMFADAPLKLRLEAEPGSEARRPVAATLQIADTQLDLQGTACLTDGQPHLALDGHIQGPNFDLPARLLDRALPTAGAYQFSFQTEITGKRFQLHRLKGEIAAAPPGDTVHISDGRIGMAPDGSIEAAIEARRSELPLALSVMVGAAAPDEAQRMARPLELKAAAPETDLSANGAIIDDGERWQLRLAARIQGKRLDTLGLLTGITLPPIGPYALDTDLHSSDGIHKCQNLRAQLGTDHIKGQLQWQDQTPRPLLTGRLLAKRLTPQTLSSLAPLGTGNAQAPMDLSWLRTFDARLDINVQDVNGFPIPVRKTAATLSVADGRLTVPFQTRVGDAPCKGQLDLSQADEIPRMALKASANQIDARKFLKPFGLAKGIGGRVDDFRLDVQSSGRTFQALLDRAILKATLSRVDLYFKGQFAGRPIDLAVASAEIAADKGGPLSATVAGTFQGLPFDARASTAPLSKLGVKQTPLPIRIDMKAAYAVFKGQGTVARPLSQRVFDLAHEISGAEVEGLDPLIDLALPLQGAFSARGTITGRGDRLTYNEELHVGDSDFRMTLDLWQNAPRPRVKAVITSETIHLEDIKLLPGNAPPVDAAGKKYLLHEYRLPIGYMRAMDLDIDIRAQRVLAAFGELGHLESKVTLQNGYFESTATITKPGGGRVSKFYAVNANTDPPEIRFEIDGDNIDYGFLQRLAPPAAMEGGALDFDLRLSGTGTTRRQFLNQVDGLLTVIGGPGQFNERRIDLWAADLIPTMLSPQWQSAETTEVNCMVAHVGIVDGLATIENILLDTRRVTIAASGIVNLKNEALDINVAPRPKNASLVSLANPVNISGTLSEPEIAVARLPGRSGRRLARTGILAGLINPLFLLTALSDIGTIDDDPCTAAVERAREAAYEETPP